MDFDLKEVEFDPEVRFVEEVYKLVYENEMGKVNLPFEEKRKALYYCLDVYCNQQDINQLILRYYYGMSYADISVLCRIAISTVNSRRIRIKDKLHNNESFLILRNGYTQALYFTAEEYQKAYEEAMDKTKEYEKAYKETMAQIKEYEKSKEAC